MRRGSVWLSMGVLWASYALVYTGYVWMRGYNVGFREIVAPVNFYQGTWPPPVYTGTGVFPTGGTAPAASSSGSSGSSGGVNVTPGTFWHWFTNPNNPINRGLL